MKSQKSRIKYNEYIRSRAWLDRHEKWLKSFGHCAAFPLISLGESDGGYQKYNMHHTHYKTLGRERLWFDVIPLSLFAHDHIVHGVLSFYQRPSEQSSYPNPFQRVFHAWCRMIMLVICFWWVVVPLALVWILKFSHTGTSLVAQAFSSYHSIFQ